ncbi:MAG: sugar ABC transporter permease [Oscillospiraceae bacterium]|nr:sugar ABC transporter permease [Oscillospiraceae bacterium]
MKEKLKNTGVKVRKKRKRSVNDPNTLFARVLAVPSLAGVLMFFVVPFIIVVYYSFVDNPINKHFVGFENYKMLFKSLAFVRAAKNTAALSFTAVPLAVVLSLMLAALLDSKIPGKSTLRSFFLSPMMVPVASVVLIWRVVFAYKGTLNAELMKIFEIDDLVKSLGAMPLDWLKSPKCLIVVSLLFLWKNLGYNMVLFLSALNNIPKDLLEVAELEGASALWRMIFIKMRYLSPTVLFVTILSLINSFKLFREIYLLTGANPYEGIYMLQHFMNNTFLTLDYQKLSSAAIVMSIVMVLIIGILFTTESLFGHDVEE